MGNNTPKSPDETHVDSPLADFDPESDISMPTPLHQLDLTMMGPGDKTFIAPAKNIPDNLGKTIVAPIPRHFPKSPEDTHVSADAETAMSPENDPKVAQARVAEHITRYESQTDPIRSAIPSTAPEDALLEFSDDDIPPHMPPHMPNEKVRDYLKPPKVRIPNTRKNTDTAAMLITEELETNESNLGDVTDDLSDEPSTKESTHVLEPKSAKKFDTENSSPFSISDIGRKIDDDLANIPEYDGDELSQVNMSMLLKSQSDIKTGDGKVRINRHFLLDAEPFSLKRLADEVKKTPLGLKMGFPSLDPLIDIPADTLTLVTGRARHGKTSFMLNMMLNMCRLYPEKHFVYYSYDESKWDVIIKLINISSTKQFSHRDHTISNLIQWKNEIRDNEIGNLARKSDTETEYAGLKYFMEVAHRIHVVQGNYPLKRLEDSFRSFNNAFDISCVFIDSFKKIKIDDTAPMGGRDENKCIGEVSRHLRTQANDMGFPLVISTGLPPGPFGTPEYDLLTESHLHSSGNLEEIAGLVIGLQNYSRSAFIGSNLTADFQSGFFEKPLEKARQMPENLKDMMGKTILLTKIIINHTGPEPEREMLFHKQLQKLSELKENL